MSLRVAWVTALGEAARPELAWAVTCDSVTGCQGRLALPGTLLAREVRWEARDEGWRVASPREGGLWLCPAHWDEGRPESWRECKEWCPWRRRRGPCACRLRPVTWDDGLWYLRLDRQRLPRPVQDVATPPGLL